jgi:hypothetical protein
MKIRLHGTKGECAATAQRIAQVITVLSVSEPYPDRGASVLVRVYLEARPGAPNDPQTARSRAVHSNGRA